ncbi:hypothetical protein [Crenobacter luteus]|uniref:DUF4160 domain-containing protein n=1 Tax=Crenobacter luteus TaxID=1452487 RepID=A0A161S820_9NEIS|nr:hypothetical protein [Crenobacter luteus]KZE29600.1 hypothetical protein AVW16_01370 [Crenobacter luteus]
MLELIDARPDGRREIMVHAEHNKVPVHFHIAADAVDDFLGIESTGVENAVAGLKRHWERFVPRVEGFVARHGGHDFLLTSEMLNP